MNNSYLKEVKEIAQLKGGECLSEVYEGSMKKLLFKCENGHIFESTPTNIKHNNQWCKECSVNRQRSGLLECKQLAIRRGGKCLESDYKNQHEKMLWQCAAGHTWKARYGDIKRNAQWCPTCASGIGERICRLFFEELFDCAFPKTYPIWLINDLGNQMELDGYSSKYKLAFEHQGDQHYSARLHYSNNEKLKKRINDDLKKKELCNSHGIILLAIPEIPTRLPINKIKKFILDELSKLKISSELSKCLDSFKKKHIDYNRAYIYKPLEPIREIALEKGGKLISKSYLGIFEKLDFICKHGHKFKKSPSHIIHRGQWCPVCSKIENKQSTKEIEELRKIAKIYGGVLISDSSLGAHSHHIWRCSKGHEFNSTPANVSQGKWCPICAKIKRKEKTRKEYEDKFLKVLKNKGGRISEGFYKSIKQPVLVTCGHGHVWSARPESIFKGSWCPDCKKISFRTKYEKKLLKVISINEGKILQGKYETMKSKIKVECAFGHIWSARVDGLIGGSWCPLCKKDAIKNGK
ncbi:MULTISPECIES: zinc-ribbon domain-containing protein [unclassified Carboxylicivirga]|uniref:zinc-ribbon domain-containing protein n=1 Tax=Carboxylicivirga TaxID=1628153 RepID=UPI003D34E6A7